MANDDILDDDYVAKLLAKDAKESSIRYSSIGLQAFAQSKPPANKPKPNTRFLRNIIKDTDNHNQALLAKEAAEARARLRDLPSSEKPQDKSRRVGTSDIRKRQLGDIAAILGGRPPKRKRVERVGEGGRRVNTSSEDEEVDPKGKASSERKKSEREERGEGGRSRGHRSSHKRHRSASPDGGNEMNERRRRHRSRSRSPREHRIKDTRHRERSPRRKHSRSPESERRRDRSHRSHKRRRSLSNERKPRKDDTDRSSRKPQPEADFDSDPLDDIIGPRPPPVPQVRTRGRGTISHASGIDSRFSSTYDPTADVQLDPDEENDWDQALEALRDRQKWKKQGADRLRAAGFTEDEINKWEKGGEKREEDVKWAKKGEGREWDRGKVLNDDGIVTSTPEFGRLKDT